MKAVVVLIAVLGCPGIVSAMSFWAALAEIESGGNDYAVGEVGEISRYQIRPEVWRVYSSSRRYADPSVALPIAEKYMAKLKHDFEQATGRAPTESDCVILWKSGLAGYEKRDFNPARMSAAHRDRINRFHNLRMAVLTLPRRARQKSPPQTVLSDTQKPLEVITLDNFFLTPAVARESSPGPNDVLIPIGHANQPEGIFTQTQGRPGTVSLFMPYLR